MISLITKDEARIKLAEYIRIRRLDMDLSQEGLSLRCGVSLPTLRRFEQKGVISLESFIKIFMVVGDIDDLLDAVKPKQDDFKSIDDVIKQNTKSVRQRGRKK